MRSAAVSFLIPLVLVLQTACGERPEPRSGPETVVRASIMVTAYEPVHAMIEAPATVQARHRIALSAQINGFVREMLVRSGDLVKEGQTLATLDARDAESQKATAEGAIAEALAALEEARSGRRSAVEMAAAAKASSELAGATYARYQKLLESRSVSPQEMDEVRMRRNASLAELASRESMVAAAEKRITQAEARIAQAKAQAGRADVMVSWTRIKAPLTGRVVERSADAGTAIFPGTPLLTIESNARPQAVANLPIEHRERVRVGMDVELERSGELLSGRIAEIIPVSDPATHSMQLKIDLPAEAPAPTGQFVRVRIPGGDRSAMLIPRSALRETGQLSGVFVLDSEARARFRLVKTTSYDKQRVESLSGLEPGERVVVRDAVDIVDGVRIEAGPGAK